MDLFPRMEWAPILVYIVVDSKLALPNVFDMCQLFPQLFSFTTSREKSKHTLNTYILESKAPCEYNTGAYMKINTAWSETGSVQQCDCVSNDKRRD